MNAASTIQDSPYAWFRLAVSLALATIGGIGIWSGIVVLPFIQIEFGVDRSGASFPYTMSMIGFAVGGLLMGRLADRFGIMVPMFLAPSCWGSASSPRPLPPPITSMLPPRRFSSAWAAPRFSAPWLPTSRSGSKSAAASPWPSRLPETTSPAPSGRPSSPGAFKPMAGAMPILPLASSPYRSCCPCRCSCAAAPRSMNGPAPPSPRAVAASP